MSCAAIAGRGLIIDTVPIIGKKNSEVSRSNVQTCKYCQSAIVMVSTRKCKMYSVNAVLLRSGKYGINPTDFHECLN